MNHSEIMKTECHTPVLESDVPPPSGKRVSLSREVSNTVRDAIDHLHDDGMHAMAYAVEVMLKKAER